MSQLSIAPYGSKEFDVTSSQKLAVRTNGGEAVIYQSSGPGINVPSTMVELARVDGEERVFSFTANKTVLIDAGPAEVLYEVAMSYELDVLVEVHSNTSLQRILDQFTPKIIGINNRDLTSFHTTVEHTEKIISNVPKESIVVSESGIFTKEDLDFVFKCGANAVLVGESLMRKSNQCQAIHELFGENVNVK